MVRILAGERNCPAQLQRHVGGRSGHVPLKLSWTVPLPGKNSDHVSPSPWMRSRSPLGDQLNVCTGLSSNSWRGNPASLTIPNPPGPPPPPSLPTPPHPFRPCSDPAL